MQRMLLTCVLLTLTSCASAWTHSGCNGYRAGWVACSFRNSGCSGCTSVYWYKTSPGGYCCSPTGVNRCANIGSSQYHKTPANWGGWSGWGGCSSSCGGGRKYRTRKCEGSCAGSCSPGDTQQDSDSCSGGTPYAWSGWGGYGSCSATCGGKQTRTRSCTGNCGSWCSGSSSESIPCSTGTQRSWSGWGGWGSCSTQCGTGQRHRYRSCQGDCGSCSGSDQGSEPCNEGIAAAWTPWGSWAACSTPCGTGTKRRTRQCTGTCSGTCTLGVTEDEDEPCTLAVPRAWAAWSAWGACDGCGIGEQHRIRRCEGSCDGSCTADASESDTQACPGDTPATWTAWAPWETCNVDCGKGKQPRSRTCEGECQGACGNVGHVETPTRDCVATAPAAVDEWSSWSSCDAICGVANRTRTQQCSVGCPSDECAVSREVHTEEQFCKEADWGPWSSWSAECSTSCGLGELTRTRRCEGLCQTASSPCTPGATDDDTKPCAAGTPAAWAQWTPSVCADSVRPWARTCRTNCHGYCAGAAVDGRNCTWSTLQLWTGPLHPQAAAPLTAQALTAGVSQPLRDALVLAMGGNEAMVNRLEPLMSSSQRSQRRRTASHVNNTLTTRPGIVAGTVWVAVTAYIVPETESTVEPALPVVANATGAAAGLAMGSLVLTMQPVIASPSSQGNGSAGVTVGAVVATLFILIMLTVLWVRHQRRRVQFVTHSSKRNPLAPEEQQAQPWMLNNPAFEPGAAQDTTESDANNNGREADETAQGTKSTVISSLPTNPVYRSADRDILASGQDAIQPNPAYLGGSARANRVTEGLQDNAAYLSAGQAAPALPPRDEIYRSILAATVPDSVQYESNANAGAVYDQVLPGTAAAGGRRVLPQSGAYAPQYSAPYASPVYEKPVSSAVAGLPHVAPRKDMYIAIASTLPKRRIEQRAEHDNYAGVSFANESIKPALPPKSNKTASGTAYLAIGVALPRTHGVVAGVQGSVRYDEASATAATHAPDVPPRALSTMRTNPPHVPTSRSGASREAALSAAGWEATAPPRPAKSDNSQV